MRHEWDQRSSRVSAISGIQSHHRAEGFLRDTDLQTSAVFASDFSAAAGFRLLPVSGPGLVLPRCFLPPAPGMGLIFPLQAWMCPNGEGNWGWHATSEQRLINPRNNRSMQASGRFRSPGPRL